MRRAVTGSDVVVQHVSMGRIGPGRTIQRRRLHLECGHTKTQKLCMRVFQTTECYRCEDTGKATE